MENYTHGCIRYINSQWPLYRVKYYPTYLLQCVTRITIWSRVYSITRTHNLWSKKFHLIVHHLISSSITPACTIFCHNIPIGNISYFLRLTSKEIFVVASTSLSSLFQKALTSESVHTCPFSWGMTITENKCPIDSSYKLGTYCTPRHDINLTLKTNSLTTIWIYFHLLRYMGAILCIHQLSR